ncbi:TetR/AcrR family transcriptional regulator [Kineococcus rhizosphaerae]|uniref:TetR family transcriptional regulator n=1 Tax=Kineococcus rhizosphaerae TaxID=559628 RepID=A0A2T0QXH9_9ACTN|nr:TetR/AcrR family transcriptional regulator [Kineococcus rhizosphaerae]PRY10741.1 TetR family transcriptional regulator [Kineococcus rhizosphaerae]
MTTRTARTKAGTRQRVLDVAEDLIARKGWSAAGVNEVLTAAGVPTGSFYHHFGSKDAFGRAVLENYFSAYLATMDEIAATPGTPAAQRLMRFWQQFHDKQTIDDCQGRCLVVKLAAEVSDLSETLRATLDEGTTGIIARVEQMLRAGEVDGSLQLDDDPAQLATWLYGSWLGASLLAKTSRDRRALDTAMTTTRRLLGV